MSYISCEHVDLKELLGKTLESVTRRNVSIGYEDNDGIVFNTTLGEEYALTHQQGCCESVSIDDICGNLDDLVGSPILIAREDTNVPSKSKGGIENELKGVKEYDSEGVYEDESFTWTWYNFATIKGYVTVKFYGTSNGYYSESAELYRLNGDD